MVAKGGGIALAGTAITRAVNYLYSIVLVWGLGAENFGLYTLALAVVNLFGVVAELGLSLSIVRFGAIEEAQGRAGVHRVTKTALLISVPTALLLLALLQASASTIADDIFHKPELGDVLRILAWSVPLMSIQSLLAAAAKARKLVKYSTLVGATQAVTALLLAILFMALRLGFSAVALSFLLSYALGASLAFLFYLRVIPRQGPMGLYPVKQMVRFSLPLTFTKWIQFLNERTEVLFLGLLPSAVYVGIYKIAWSLAGLETMLRLSLEEILAPFSSALSHRREISELGSLYKTTAKWSFTAALLLAFIYFLFGSTIMRLFDPTFVVGASVLVVLAFAQLFNEATGACGTILIMAGRSDLSFLNTVVLFVSSVALDWTLIPRYGLAGAAFAGAFTVVLVNILRVVEVWFHLKIHPFTWSFLKPIGASLFAAAVIWGVRSFVSSTELLTHLVHALVFVSVYVAAVLLLRLDAADRLVLRAIQGKLSSLASGPRGAA